ncbi:MAG: hypothetical protein JNL58_11055 [Planctomyces sp.]|nr:hypothetical protein [Planctomyces sp.]
MASSIDRDEEREQQLNAIIAEYYRLEEAGATPGKQKLMARYPEFRDALIDFFTDLESFLQSKNRL